MIINIDTVFPKKSALFGITTDYSHSKLRFTDVLNHFTHCESPWEVKWSKCSNIQIMPLLSECLDIFTVPQVTRGNIRYNHLAITGLHILKSENVMEIHITVGIEI